MAAGFDIIKYTGKDGTFGTPVCNIGIKRIDSAVPAVYGDTDHSLVASDDSSDVNTYCVYVPDDENEIVHSFESVFKLVLNQPPNNQLSNIRVYPVGNPPEDMNDSSFFIGCSTIYTRPTNQKSKIAKDNIWNYSKHSPFLITVGGNKGQYVDPKLAVIDYHISLHDIGYGNLMYLNNERQINVPLIIPSDESKTYKFIDETAGKITFTIYDMDNNVIDDSSIVSVYEYKNKRIVEFTLTKDVFIKYPNGFKYGDSSNIDIGYIMTWIDLSQPALITETYDVFVDSDLNGRRFYYFNGIRAPEFTFTPNKIFVFKNHNGNTDPLRFVKHPNVGIANNEHDIVVDGITVENGGTIDEVVTVNVGDVLKSGFISGYESVFHPGLGNRIMMHGLDFVGNYNVNTVGAGVYNPLAAGETDYIYMQLEVSGKSTAGQGVPELIIEYDEN